MLRINDVVVFGEARYRILDVSDIRYTWINIDSDKAFPERVSLAEVEDFILSETLKKVDDPYSHLAAQLLRRGFVQFEGDDGDFRVFGIVGAVEPLAGNHAQDACSLARGEDQPGNVGHGFGALPVIQQHRDRSLVRR